VFGELVCEGGEVGIYLVVDGANFERLLVDFIWRRERKPGIISAASWFMSLLCVLRR